MRFSDLFFPKFCVQCKKAGEYICTKCFATLSFDTKKVCLVCERPAFGGMTHPGCKGKFTIDGTFCALSYKGILPKLVYQFKYKPYLRDLQHILSDLFYESLIQEEEFVQILKEKPIFVPIPLTRKREKQRGYNHAALLAKGLGKRLNIHVLPLLERVKETKPQYGLKKDERKENMKNAFGIDHKSPMINGKSKTAILVDDILTSGSTFLEAAKVLKKNGFEKVYGIALAKD